MHCHWAVREVAYSTVVAESQREKDLWEFCRKVRFDEALCERRRLGGEHCCHVSVLESILANS